MNISAFLVFALIFGGNANPWNRDLGNLPDNPKELGDVRWMRGFRDASVRAKEKKLPLLILFQEVPGCSTCITYGQRVLSHPLLVEAAETLFVPLVVYNNVKGEDRQTLTRFREPSWNNPVVRITDSSGQLLAPRLAGDYQIGGLAETMVAALEKAGAPIPLYLQNVALEFSAKNGAPETVSFAMYCFWTGEAAFGSVPGVISTEPGFMGRKEVVRVTFLPNISKLEQLLAIGQNNQCADGFYSQNPKQRQQAAKVLIGSDISSPKKFRPDRQPKYYMSKTLYRFLPMTSLQATRVNAAIARGQNPDLLLSPRQIQVLNALRNNPKGKWKDVIGSKDFIGDWKQVVAFKKP